MARVHRRRWRTVAVAIGAAIVVVATGVVWQLWPRSPFSKRRTRCGDAYKEQPTAGGNSRAGCQITSRHDLASLWIELRDGRVVKIDATASRGDTEMVALRTRVLALVEPFVDGDQLAAARRTIATVEPELAEPSVEVIGGATIAGALQLWHNAPERRHAKITVTYDEPAPVPARRRSWPAGFQRIEPAMVDALGAWCRDGSAMTALLGGPERVPVTWRTGDLWLTCEVTRRASLRFEIIWNPDRNVVAIALDAPDAAIDGVLARVAAPFLSEAQRLWLAADKRHLASSEDRMHITERSRDGATSLELSATD